jgi:hypothetical protein
MEIEQAATLRAQCRRQPCDPPDPRRIMAATAAPETRSPARHCPSPALPAHRSSFAGTAGRFFACCSVRETGRSPCSRFSLHHTASALSWCMASNETARLRALRACSSMIRADSRETPVKYSSSRLPVRPAPPLIRSGLTMTRSRVELRS